MNSQSQGRTPCNCIGKFPKSSNENFKAFCNSFKSHVKNFDPMEVIHLNKNRKFLILSNVFLIVKDFYKSFY